MPQGTRVLGFRVRSFASYTLLAQYRQVWQDGYTTTMMDIYEKSEHAVLV